MCNTDCIFFNIYNKKIRLSRIVDYGMMIMNYVSDIISDVFLILEGNRRERLIDDDGNNDAISKMLYFENYQGYNKDKIIDGIVRFWRF